MIQRLKRMLCMILLLSLTFLLLPAEGGTADLAQLQERLLSLGYEIGTADGIPGTMTTLAVQLAQTLLAGAGFDVSPTGEPDETTKVLIIQEENSELLRTLIK